MNVGKIFEAGLSVMKVLIVGFLFIQCGEKKHSPEENVVSIIPRPVQLQKSNGYFTIDPETTIHIVGEEANTVGVYLAEMISASSSFDLSL